MPTRPKKPLRINILLPCPRAGRYWGDYHFGESLRNAFADFGVTARIIYRPRWKSIGRLSLRRGVDLHIRGPANHVARIWPWVRTYFWLISFSDLAPEDRARSQHAFAASPELAARLADEGLSTSVLLQCTDRDRFSPDRQSESLSADILFVGSNRSKGSRPIIDLALKVGVKLAVWGTRWTGHIPDEYLKGTLIPNDQLGSHYASAKVVLNDHLPAMREYRMASNRVFDVLASGTQLISDFLPDLGIALPSAAVVVDEDAFKETVTSALADSASDEKRKARLELAEHIRNHHSFHVRAASILETLTRELTSSQPRPPLNHHSHGDT